MCVRVTCQKSTIFSSVIVNNNNNNNNNTKDCNSNNEQEYGSQFQYQITK